MSVDERRFEEFLREFEARRPRPLPYVAARSEKWRRSAAAAVTFAVAGGSLWVCLGRPGIKNAQHNPVRGQGISVVAPPPGAISSTVLTRAALEDKELFETETDALARSCLPAFDQANSALGALSKE
jgi:hypothetical protein